MSKTPIGPHVTRPQPEAAAPIYCAGEVKLGQWPHGGRCFEREQCSLWHQWQGRKEEPDAKLAHVMNLPRIGGRACHYFKKA